MSTHEPHIQVYDDLSILVGAICCKCLAVQPLTDEQIVEAQSECQVCDDDDGKLYACLVPARALEKFKEHAAHIEEPCCCDENPREW